MSLKDVNLEKKKAKDLNTKILKFIKSKHKIVPFLNIYNKIILIKSQIFFLFVNSNKYC